MCNIKLLQFCFIKQCKASQHLVSLFGVTLNSIFHLTLDFTEIQCADFKVVLMILAYFFNS